MVMIQVMIAEVVLDDFDEFGVELGLQDSLLFDRSVVVDNMLAPGFAFNTRPLGNSSDANSVATRDNIGGQGLTNFGVGRTNMELGYGGLVLSASSESVSILIRALKDSRRLQVLSRPQVMTLENQPAFIQIGQRVPRITSSQVTTTGTINNTVLENVGILLGVTPRISPDGTVVMEIDAEKSELAPDDEGIPILINANGDVVRSPIINTITAQTTVTARSGQTVVLGGLITKNKQSISRRVPWLSDVWFIGNFFRFDSQLDRRTETLFIMTPIVVEDEATAELLKQQESSRMSWCLADVIEVYGEAGLSPGRLCDACGGECHCGAMPEVIYPDAMPTLAEPIPAAEPGGPVGSGAAPPADSAPTPVIPSPALPNRLTPPQQPATPPAARSGDTSLRSPDGSRRRRVRPTSGVRPAAYRDDAWQDDWRLRPGN